jgi:hypothetical protein
VAPEPIELVHSANTVLIARSHQALWVPWAHKLEMATTKQLPDSQIIWESGSVWRTVATSNLWGRTLDRAFIDEAWAWSADEFWAGVYPTLVERPGSMAQLAVLRRPVVPDPIPAMTGASQ